MRSSPALLPILAVGAVIRNDAGAVLLVRRGRPPRQGEWSIPGGKVEWGETVRDALLREIREETGLTIELIGLIEIVDSFLNDAEGKLARHHVHLDYAGRVVSGTLEAGDDALEACWVLDAELDAYPMWSETRRIIAATRV